ncbi:MAG: hypothetical protein H7A18_09195 [Sinobacteraceae bacterium]|nr:hypothetical protein [Nevskiaceae bacterium]MCP5359948.1 hypothetical protein [Nevskiaceae bacterium]MCP5472233.1 hypothetical protein [Nevskiaceae bacterium]
MTEQPIFWRGGSPDKSINKSKDLQPPEAVHFEPALRDVCTACGYEVKDYFAALGEFGSWLLHMKRGGQKHRIFWNAKSKQLTHEESRLDGWVELATMAHEDASLPGFVTGLKVLLDRTGKV